MYKPLGQLSWDYWFAKEEDIYHAYYLQYRESDDLQYQHSRQTVGHAISKDLIHWTEQKTALAAVPGTWNDVGIATGSVVKKDGIWHMLFSGNSSVQNGIGLAQSSDLFTWNKTGDGPVIPYPTYYEVEWEGKTLVCYPLADPYIYPRAVDGWFYSFVNSQVKGAEPNLCGCMLILRSKDLIHWESWKVAAYPHSFERMETAQVWEHGGRWYMYFGGVNNNLGRISITNFIYTSSSFSGPYKPERWSRIALPKGESFYIGKTLKDPAGDDVFLAVYGFESLSDPYCIIYNPDDSITFKI